MIIMLDGRRMTDRTATHEYLKEMLALPDYYGRNLDALYDHLTERSAPITITVTHAEELHAALGPYASSLLKTMGDAARKNPALTIDF